MATILGDNTDNVLNGTPNDDNISSYDGDDVLYGFDGNDTLQGWGGDDTIFGGNGDDRMSGGIGDNRYDGGAGTDMVYFNGSSSLAVHVDLNITGPQNTGRGMETLISIENLTGSGSDDTLIGNAVDNLFGGAQGDDTMFGNGGNDHLVGFSRNDIIHGGTGDDRLRGQGDNDIIYDNTGLIADNGNDSLEGDAGMDLLYSAGGQDTIIGGADFDILYFERLTETSDVSFEALAGGAVFTETGDNSVIMQIEQFHVSLGYGHDTIRTLGADDVIYGNNGNDVIEGRGGADTMFGGNGFDTVSYASAAAGVRASLFTGTGTAGDAAGDVFTGFEFMVGSAFNDVLGAGATTNRIDAGGGDDTIIANGGANTYDGGAGVDTIDYSGSLNSVVINMFTGAYSSGFATADAITNVENLTGTAFGDTLTGDTGDNVLIGLTGDDILSGYLGNDTLQGGLGNDFMTGGAGADNIDGGAGTDMARYIGSNAGVTIDLGAGTAAGGHAAGDVLTGIENLFGSSHGDILTGNSGNNILFGSGGADVISSGAGTDNLFGGADADTFVFENGHQSTKISDFQDDVDVLDLSSYGFANVIAALAQFSPVGTAHAQFTDGTDTLLIINMTVNDIANDILI